MAIAYYGFCKELMTYQGPCSVGTSTAQVSATQPLWGATAIMRSVRELTLDRIALSR